MQAALFLKNREVKKKNTDKEIVTVPNDMKFPVPFSKLANKVNRSARKVSLKNSWCDRSVRLFLVRPKFHTFL